MKYFECVHKEGPSIEEGFITRCFIDGYPADENEEGEVVATVTLTLHGDIIVDWHDNSLRLNQEVLALIDDCRNELRLVPTFPAKAAQFAVVKTNSFSSNIDVTLFSEYEDAAAFLKKEWREYYDEELLENGNLCVEECYLEEECGKITWENMDGDFTKYTLTSNIYTTGNIFTKEE